MARIRWLKRAGPQAMKMPGQGPEKFVPAHVAEVVTRCQEHRLLILRRQRADNASQWHRPEEVVDRQPPCTPGRAGSPPEEMPLATRAVPGAGTGRRGWPCNAETHATASNTRSSSPWRNPSHTR